MANDEFDNRRTDDEMLAKLQRDTPPDARIDMQTWPHSVQIAMNRIAAENVMAKLRQCLDVCAPSASFLLEFTNVAGGTRFMISADDAQLRPDGTPARPS